MKKIRPLPKSRLFSVCDAKQFTFKTTAELKEFDEIVGQERALAAMDFGINIHQPGFNLYIQGPAGIGKHSAMLNLLKKYTTNRFYSDEWCYVYNFNNPRKPRAVKMKQGYAKRFQQDMYTFIEEVHKKNAQKVLNSSVVQHSLTKMKEKYKEFTSVLDYLNNIELNIDDTSVCYQVNILISHDSKCVPIIYEDNPTYLNVMGQIEQKVELGILTTDHTLIRAGSLHRANGGYLLLDANKVLEQPYVWAAIKRALYAHEIRIEPLSEMLGLFSTVNLEPEPIPLQVKIVMMGDRATYYCLCSLDPDFAELFKVEVDFNEEMERSCGNNLLYARLLANLIRKADLLPFDYRAVARMIEYSSRLASDSERLSLHIRDVDDLLRESDYWARQENRRIVKSQDVEMSIQQKRYRANRLQKSYYAEIERGNILVDTKSLKVGQINALSVLHLGHYPFGIPTRITAAVRLGKGDIINIEREVNLSGDIHAKSVYILSGFIYNRYAKDYALSLLASLVFEQSYSEIEGDSASVPELCALLSAIGEFPIKQSLAVTGSVNQIGQIQPVGGVNEKIEGFFSICDYFGLTGEQGVIIPAANIKHLMLAHEVIDAVSAKKFNIYAVETVDETLQLLTGLKAGQRDKEGNFTPGSCNAKVEQRLREFAMHSEGK